MRLFLAGLLITTWGCNSRPVGPPDYHRDVAPLFAAHCQECHRPGGVAPPAPALEDYASARSYAEPIRIAVETRSMPPWLADDSGLCGRWDDARWLSDQDISTIASWQEAGAPEGAPDTITAATPVLPLFRADAVLDIGGVYKPGLGAGGYRCFLTDPELVRDRLLAAIRVVSDDPRAVAQVTVFALDSAAAEAAATALDADEPGLGYSCFGTSRVPDSRLVASWTWPTPVLRMPAGTGVRLGSGRRAVVQIHYDIAYTSSAFETGTRVELEFDDGAREARVMAVSADGPLAPGLADVVVESGQLVEARIRVVAVAPRMHIRGKTMRLVSERSAGATCVASFARWDVYAQQLFRAASPIVVEPGDRLHLSCAYDTLGRTAPVNFGDGIDDEECVAYLFVTN